MIARRVAGALLFAALIGCPGPSSSDPAPSSTASATIATASAPPEAGPDPSADRARREADVYALLGGAGASALPVRATSSGVVFDHSLRGRLTLDPWFVRIRMDVKAEGVPLPAIRKVMAAQHDAMAYCYALGFRNNPNLIGTVTVRFDLVRAGIEHETHVTTLPDPAVVTCVAERLARVTYPHPAAPPAQVEVTWTFVPT